MHNHANGKAKNNDDDDNIAEEAASRGGGIAQVITKQRGPLKGGELQLCQSLLSSANWPLHSFIFVCDINVGYHTLKITLPVIPLTVPVTLPIPVM